MCVPVHHVFPELSTPLYLMVQQADVNRLFLQSMLSRGPTPEKLAQTIWKKCVEAVNG